jgi:hypothetical protein
VVAPFHGLRQQSATHFAGEHGRDRRFEENPDMTAISRSRPFQIRGNARALASREERQRILPPCLLVEVRREKPTGFIKQERIDSYRLFPRQMLLNDFVGYSIKRTVSRSTFL